MGRIDSIWWFYLLLWFLYHYIIPNERRERKEEKKMIKTYRFSKLLRSNSFAVIQTVKYLLLLLNLLEVIQRNVNSSIYLRSFPCFAVIIFLILSQTRTSLISDIIFQLNLVFLLHQWPFSSHLYLRCFVLSNIALIFTNISIFCLSIFGVGI